MRKKIFATLIVAAVVIVTALTAFGCNKFSTETPSLADIYVDYDATQGEIDTAELSLILPDGWTVLSSASGDNADSDIGYIAGMNAFIVTNSNHDLSVVKVPEGEDKTVTEEDFLIPPSGAVRAIKAVGNYFAVRIASSSGFVGVMGSDGKWRVNANKTVDTGAAVDKNTLSSAIRILGDELVAVNPANSAETAGNSSYTPIYRISTGEMVCRINTGGSLSGILGFDGKYVSVETSSESNGKETRVYAVPDTLGDAADLAYPRYGSFVNTNGYEDYYTESLYLGGGKFYIHTEWTVDSDANYTYAYDGEYYRAVRYFYYPDEDRTESYTSSHIFLNAVNSYYDGVSGRSLGDTAVAPSSFLKDGYTYASREEVGLYDLMMQGSDGVYYSRVYPSAIRLYDGEGSLLFENKDHTYVSATLQNGIVIAGIEDEDGDTLYGAFDLAGNNVIPFEYSYIEPFRSYYTYAVTAEDNTRVLLGRDGTAAPLEEGASTHFPDIATSSSKAALEKRGCYVFTEKTEDGKTRYGVKNMSGDFDNNVVLPAALSSCTLYSPTTDNGLVFAWGTRAEDGAYCVYRMTSSADGADASPAGLPDWAVGLIAAGCTLVVAAAVIAVILAVRHRKKVGDAQ